jgi:hypothetical protein
MHKHVHVVAKRISDDRELERCRHLPARFIGQPEQKSGALRSGSVAIRKS